MGSAEADFPAHTRQDDSLTHPRERPVGLSGLGPQKLGLDSCPERMSLLDGSQAQ